MILVQSDKLSGAPERIRVVRDPDGGYLYAAAVVIHDLLIALACVAVFLRLLDISIWQAMPWALVALVVPLVRGTWLILRRLKWDREVLSGKDVETLRKLSRQCQESGVPYIKFGSVGLYLMTYRDLVEWVVEQNKLLSAGS